jgi:CPA1 family monovalent cation:H+ antiporter
MPYSRWLWPSHRASHAPTKTDFQITLTTIAAYGAFLIAERFEASGVLASLTAGLVVGNIGWRGYISQSGREHVISFWEYAAFPANSLSSF